MENGCDVLKMKSVAMKEFWKKAHILMQAGVPMTTEIYGTLVKQEMAAAREKCSPVSVELTRAQKRLVKEICPVCRLDYEEEK